MKIITGNHAIGTVRKFPTLPLNQNGVWIDPAGGIWRQASSDHGQCKENLNFSFLFHSYYLEEVNVWYDDVQRSLRNKVLKSISA